jgi:hypothetical protein
MTSIGSGSAANFDIKVWRCLVSERHENTFVRVGGKTLWLGAIGRAIRKEQLRIIAGAYQGDPAADPRLENPTAPAGT